MKQTYVQAEKRSKKAKRALCREKRVLWDFSPVSRVIIDKKKEARRKPRPDQENGWGFFCAYFDERLHLSEIWKKCA